VPIVTGSKFEIRISPAPCLTFSKARMPGIKPGMKS
jgi:hypothetical protein